ncbi:MAG: ABC transporter permease subunit [Chloroflexota bacterium]
MLTEFRNTLRRSWGAILGWGLSLGALGFFMMGFYDTLEDQRAMLEQLIAQYPPELMAFFGGNGTANLFTPAGYLTMEFFSLMPVVLGIFGVMAGSGLLAGDEENGLLDLVMAYPVSRSNLFFGRLLGFAVTLAAILGLTWLAFVAGIGTTSMDVTAVELVRPFVSLYAIVFLFGGLSLCLSMALPSRGMAGMLGGVLMVASYFIQSLSTLNESLEKVAEYLPLRYYQSGYAIEGLNSDWAWLLGFGLLFTALAWALFLRRDIRVSGEGNWRFGFAKIVFKKPA